MSATASLSQIVPILLGLPFLTLASDIPVQPNFDVKKFEGDWFPIAVVGKDAPVQQLSSHKYTVIAKRHTGIRLIFNYFENDGCTSYPEGYHEHGQPGIYAENTGEVPNFVIIQTDYSTYAVVLIDTNKLELFSRTHRSNIEIRKTFDDVAAANGFSVDKISYPVLKNPCYK